MNRKIEDVKKEHEKSLTDYGKRIPVNVKNKDERGHKKRCEIFLGEKSAWLSLLRNEKMKQIFH